MKLPPFRYHRPETIEEAVEVLAEYGSDAKVLAGGQSLVPLLALRLSRPGHLVDIGRITGLPAAEKDDAGGVVVGLGARHADVEEISLFERSAPLLREAVPHIGHRAIRNRGTVCGSLAHADPAAELPAVAVAVGAEMVIRSSSAQRIVPAGQFFAGYLTSALTDTELLAAVRFPAWAPRTGWSIQEVSRRHGDFALIGLAAVMTLETSGRVESAALAFFGAGSVPVRVVEVEDILIGEEPNDRLFSEAAAIVTKVLDPSGDNHASAAYRSHVAGVLTRRCLAEAAARGEAGVA